MILCVGWRRMGRCTQKWDVADTVKRKRSLYIQLHLSTMHENNQMELYILNQPIDEYSYVMVRQSCAGRTNIAKKKCTQNHDIAAGLTKSSGRKAFVTYCSSLVPLDST